VILIPWGKLDESAVLSERVRHLAKLFLGDKISRKKARTIENDFRMFRRFQDSSTSEDQSSLRAPSDPGARLPVDLPAGKNGLLPTRQSAT